MDDAQKIALIASFLLRYPDESWYNELGEWKADTRSVEHPQQMCIRDRIQEDQQMR